MDRKTRRRGPGPESSRFALLVYYGFCACFFVVFVVQVYDSFGLGYRLTSTAAYKTAVLTGAATLYDLRYQVCPMFARMASTLTRSPVQLNTLHYRVMNNTAHISKGLLVMQRRCQGTLLNATVACFQLEYSSRSGYIYR